MRNRNGLSYKGRTENWIDKTEKNGASADSIDDIWTHADRQAIRAGRHGMSAIVNVGVFVGVAYFCLSVFTPTITAADEAVIATTKVVADVGGLIETSANLIFIFLGGFAFFKILKYS